MEEFGTKKVLVSIRLDPEIVSFFKALGPGWTGQINDVLKRFIQDGSERFLEEMGLGDDDGAEKGKR